MRPIATIAAAALLAGCGAESAPKALVGTAEAASTTGTERPRGYLRADADGDRIVTRAEIVAEAEARFRAIDTDGDGSVSSVKLTGRRARALGTSEEAMKARSPEPITLAEFRDRALVRFERRDADGNGRLEGAELASRRARRSAAP